MAKITIDETSFEKMFEAAKSYSPKEKVNILQEMLITEAANLDPAKMAAWMDPFIKTRDARSAQGLKFSKRQDFKHPQFSAQFKGKGNCNCCQNPIMGPTPAFFMKNKGTWTLWCANANCFPTIFCKIMTANKSYNAWLNP